MAVASSASSCFWLAIEEVGAGDVGVSWTVVLHATIQMTERVSQKKAVLILFVYRSGLSALELGFAFFEEGHHPFTVIFGATGGFL